MFVSLFILFSCFWGGVMVFYTSQTKLCGLLDSVFYTFRQKKTMDQFSDFSSGVGVLFKAKPIERFNFWLYCKL